MKSRRAGNLALLWQIDLPAMAAMIAATWLAWQLVVLPGMQRQKTHDERAEDLAQRVDETDRQARLRADMDSRLAALRRAAEEDAATLLPPSAVNQQLAALNDIAVEAGVSIDELRVEDAIIGSDYRTVPIRLTGTGGFAAATRMLNRVHESMPGVAVTSFDLSGNPERPDSPASIALKFAWFAAPQPPLIGSVPD